MDALMQMNDQAPLVLQDMNAEAEPKVSALTHWTATEEEDVFGCIPEFGEGTQTTGLHQQLGRLEERMAAFEETVFAGPDGTPATNPIAVRRGRVKVSQRAAAKRTRSRSSSCDSSSSFGAWVGL